MLATEAYRNKVRIQSSDLFPMDVNVWVDTDEVFKDLRTRP